MKAGQDLDVEIATKVFRHVVMYSNGKPQVRDQKLGRFIDVPPYSTETDSAYMILNHFQHLGFVADVGSSMHEGYLLWKARFLQASCRDYGVLTHGNTLAHAVCLAGLALNARLSSET